MKFIQTGNASYINFDDVSYIGHEYNEKQNRYYSCIYLKNGKKFDFIEFVDYIELEGKEKFKLNCDHFIKLNYFALGYILDSKAPYIISIEKIEEEAYRRLDNIIGQEIKNKKDS
jgi:hypothetical protein